MTLTVLRDSKIQKNIDWACEICLRRYNCPLPLEECINDEQVCKYYIPDIEAVAELEAQVGFPRQE